MSLSSKSSMITNQEDAESLLVLGYGNSLRCDDGAGRRVAEEVAQLSLPCVSSLSVHQLTPELAQRIAAARSVVFVDARDSNTDEGLESEPLDLLNRGAEAGAFPTHVTDPVGLLTLSYVLYGKKPLEAWLLTLPAENFSYGETLSNRTERSVQEAILWITDRAARLLHPE